MKFSLIVATKDRVSELWKLFDSLANQQHKIFEVILVDQNLDDRLTEVVEVYKERFDLLHVREEISGLSRSRNIGRQYITGDIVAFPDDDSVYPENILCDIAQGLTSTPSWDGIVTSIRALDDDGYAFDTCGGTGTSADIDHQLAYNVGVSHSMFFRASIVHKLGFDEKMGVGSGTSWGAGEDTDFLFRVLDNGFQMRYESDLFVRHPRPLSDPSLRRRLKRGMSYGMGNGYFLAKHRQPLGLVTPQTIGHPFLRLAASAFWKRSPSLGAYYFTKGIGTYLGYRAGMR